MTRIQFLRRIEGRGKELAFCAEVAQPTSLEVTTTRVKVKVDIIEVRPVGPVTPSRIPGLIPQRWHDGVLQAGVYRHLRCIDRKLMQLQLRDLIPFIQYCYLE